MLGSQLVVLLGDVLETLGAYLEEEDSWRWVLRANPLCFLDAVVELLYLILSAVMNQHL